MSNTKVRYMGMREAIWLDHNTFHKGKDFPNELCIFCEAECNEIRDDHLNLEVTEAHMEMADREEREVYE